MSGTQRQSQVTGGGPPYRSNTAGLGGKPELIPDVPISAVFLALYLIFGVIHIKIFKNNKGRGHKFVFNGAILGLCKIRIITMSLRIAWACHPKNIGLAITANVFVYVGTIILYMVDWFFVQRIVRGQHARIGWSTPYRIFHRGALACLVIMLFMLMTASIWQSFTLNSEKLRIFHAIFVTAQTYFTVFCLAPAVLVLLSFTIPRTEVEKFGAGRLGINIIILLIAVAVLSVGQIFRCVLAWLPSTPLRNAQGQPVDTPWYLHKACFYVFNFVTEIIVIIMFALVRVDLRFYIPNGSRIAGDYSGRNSRYTVNTIDSEKDLTQAGGVSMTHQNNSSQTLHQYQTSVFEDTHTLADSLKYGSSTLEVDKKTGNWKVKRVSTESTSARNSLHSSRGSAVSHHDRKSLVNGDIPPVPDIPTQWPLPDSAPPHSSKPVLEHPNPQSRRGTPKRTFEIEGHHLNDFDIGDAVTDALTKLEQNSDKNKLHPPTPPPHYNCCTAPIEVYKPTLPGKNEKQPATCPTCRNHSTDPSNSTLSSTQQNNDPQSSSSSDTTNASTQPDAPKRPQTPTQMPQQATAALTSHPTRQQQQQQQSSSSGTRSVSDSAAVTHASSSWYRSSGSTSSSADARDYASAHEEEVKRVSFDSAPALVSPIREMKPQRGSLMRS
ncbi:uncharacterized protein K460DRAFT_319525 [Cucurbitaria berberidis CBS 394.84]|uniref:Uncharacterized protein n=1 Tax=Cucurbitaria berberidis CBS 394.84 TaxID=1168544 RepID=A0A9P4GAZ5_9PLEO|nr:uncharacterized protein K460DRAFT_319525 [Cucurbitaria berberidis CBS 394.84]KAF1841944.1 hypothetical protein K460DRAFT_319525 [Cucurbitaria berberidis CBS 394.84]